MAALFSASASAGSGSSSSSSFPLFRPFPALEEPVSEPYDADPNRRYSLRVRLPRAKSESDMQQAGAVAPSSSRHPVGGVRRVTRGVARELGLAVEMPPLFDLNEPACLHYRQRSAHAKAAKRIAMAAADDDDENDDSCAVSSSDSKLVSEQQQQQAESEQASSDDCDSDSDDSTDCTSTESVIARRQLRAALYPQVARDDCDGDTETEVDPEPVLVRISRDNILAARQKQLDDKMRRGMEELWPGLSAHYKPVPLNSARMPLYTNLDQLLAPLLSNGSSLALAEQAHLGSAWAPAAPAAPGATVVAPVQVAAPVEQAPAQEQVAFCVNLFVRGVTRVPGVPGLRPMDAGSAAQTQQTKSMRPGDLLYSCMQPELGEMEEATRYLLRDGTRYMLGLMNEKGVLLSRKATVASAKIRPNETLTACIVLDGINLQFCEYSMSYVTLSHARTKMRESQAYCIPVWSVPSFHTLEHMKLAWLAATFIHTGRARYETYKNLLVCSDFRMQDGRLFSLYVRRPDGTYDFQTKARANYYDLETLGMQPRNVIELLMSATTPNHPPHIF